MAEEIYSDLRPERQEIRLMFLEAGEPNEELKARLMVTSLRWAAEYWTPEFEALSYVWGDPLITRQIKVNGQPFQVTENLEAALRRLRHDDRVRIMWIDAICINQRDPREQEHQIGLMRDIFEGCSQCIVWLGDEDNETEKALETLQWMSDNLHVHKWPCFDILGNERISKNIDWSMHGIETVMGPLQRFLCRPWFSRTWTFQEFILPRIHEIRCGDFYISYKLLLRSQRNLYDHLAGCCRAGKRTGVLQDVNEQLFRQIYSLAKTRNLPEKAEALDFLIALEDNRHRTATRDHDKVYGLLGLAPPVFQKLIVPDYRLDVPTVYAQPLVTYWQTNACLIPLLSSRNRDPKSHLPSWVPDWSSASNPSFLIIWWRRRYALYNACGHHRLYPRIYDYKVLHVQGVKCDTMKTHCKIIDPPFGKNRYLGGTPRTEAMKSWLETAMSLYKSENVSARQLAFWRAMILDGHRSFPERGAVQRASECDYDTLRKHFDEPQAPTPYIKRLLNEVHNCVFNAQFVVTDNGSTAMVPFDTQKGDEVFILAGGNMPFVLRPSEATFSPPGSAGAQNLCYTVVGKCYLDEAMDGQFAGRLRTEAVDIYIV